MREWMILSAETIRGQNYLIARHESGAMHRFGADSTWAMYGSELMTVPNNGDRGESRSSNALTASAREEIFRGNPFGQSAPEDETPSIDPGTEETRENEPVFDEYRAVAAEVTQHGREILMINRDGTAAIELLFDDDWVFIEVFSSVDLNPGHIQRLERKFFADLSGFVAQQEA